MDLLKQPLRPAAIPAGRCAAALQNLTGISRKSPGTPTSGSLQGDGSYNLFWTYGRHTPPFVTKMIVTKRFFICGSLVNGKGMPGRRPYKAAIMLVNFKQNAPKQNPRAAANASKETARSAGLSYKLLPVRYYMLHKKTQHGSREGQKDIIHIQGNAVPVPCP